MFLGMGLTESGDTFIVLEYVVLERRVENDIHHHHSNTGTWTVAR